MTRRGFWFLAFSAGALVISISLPAQFSLTLFSSTALIWFACHWSLLQLRADLVARRLRLVRSVNGRPCAQVTLWEDQPAEIMLRLEATGLLGLPTVRAIDRLPPGMEHKGDRTVEASAENGQPLTIRYQIRPSSPGYLRFEGVQIELADTAGFFSIRLFLRQVDVVTVMPALVADEKQRPLKKRGNRIPAHGIHRHLQSGSGSELLNLRDYQMGDPPKRIAWKISARRDQLTTKDYESEVPVRTTLFLDTSASMRLGWPGATSLEQAIQIAATLIRRLAERRDPVGLCLVGHENPLYLPPAPGRRQETRLLQELCRVAMEPPEPTECPAPLLVEPAHRACQDLYPELLDPKWNRRYRLYEWRLGWMAILNFVPLLVGFLISGWSLARQERWSVRASIASAVVGAALSLIFLIIRRTWGKRAQDAHSTVKSRRERKEVSSVVAAVRRLGADGLAMMIHHDETFSRETQSFLVEHRVPYRRPLYDDRGRYIFANEAKIAEAARSLLRATAHAHDNEMFIFLIDLFDHEASWGPLIEAMKLARAKHHEVLVVAPWPAELAVPSHRSGVFPLRETLAAPMSHSSFLTDQYFRSYERLSRELGRIGVTFAVAHLPETVDEVLRRIEVVRLGRISIHH